MTLLNLISRLTTYQHPFGVLGVRDFKMRDHGGAGKAKKDGCLWESTEYRNRRNRRMDQLRRDDVPRPHVHQTHTYTLTHTHLQQERK